MSQYPEDEFDVAGRERGPQGVHREPPSLLRSLAPFIAVIIIVPLLAWGVVSLIGDDGGNGGEPAATPTAEATVDPTGDPTGEPATTEPPDEGTTPAEEEPTADEETTEPGAGEDVILTTSVSVLNGAGISGIAGDAASQLTAEGFTSVGAADYGAAEPTATTLYYRNAELAPTAEAIGELLGISNLVEAPSATQNVEIAIVLRADFADR
ncbi:LytR C-terminal domain-containing protein [Georgenia sp. H159]|uniref:LytR C-terminal domain-containing protein n=1 Tax=Georgenia sp. H159 TaxID=3076115 RepID=UPI002D76B8D0|nr:LytR C-terminal domain-containing protein [Georgenia sp. H159]